jgi:hypothetical protein
MNDFEKQLQDQLRAAETSLPPGVETRLRYGRQQALEAPAPSLLHKIRWPVTGMAMASLMALVITFSPGNNETQKSVSLEPPVSSQDLDFYYWLAETQPLNGT